MTPANAAFPTLRIMGDDDKLQPLFLLSDEPIDASGDDGLSMNQTARVIAEAALGSATPFTIGIFGAWGHGKTSLLNAARTLLEPVKPDGTITRPYPHIVTVQFNAWRYEREEHPIVPLVASIAKAVKQRLDDDKTFEQAVGATGKAIAQNFYNGAISLISAIKVDTGFGIGFDAGAALENLSERQLNREKETQPRIQSWFDRSLYLSAFDDLARLHAVAKQSGANQTGQTPVIVVFIDDLDRCRPEAAVEILEGIKLVLSQPGFVFALALYREVIERYLERQAELRYGVERKDIGAGYIDKIVQLPLWLPSHEKGFPRYIRNLIKTKLKPGLLPIKADRTDDAVKSTRALLAAIYRCTPLLARLSMHSPRKLVRKINELLIDDRLLPDNAHSAIGCKPEQRRAILFPFLLIQRALQELSFPKQMDDLVANESLCAALAEYRLDLADKTDPDGNVAPMLFRDAIKVKLQDGKPDASQPKPAPAAIDPALRDIDAVTAARWLKATDCLSQNEYRAVLLNTTAGRAWLANHSGRRLVAKAVAAQAATPAATATNQVGPFAARVRVGDAPARSLISYDINNEGLRQEIAIIEREIRKHLNVKSDASLGPAEFVRVKRLKLISEPITDAGAAWLADPATGLTALTTLILDFTLITDAGAKALAAKDSGLRALTELSLWATEITDAGAAALAANDSCLRSLTTLDLAETQVTDKGAASLAAKDTGLRALTTLDLVGTQITDSGAAALAAKDSGLQALTSLDLGATQIMDAGAKALAAKDSGLRALTALDLGTSLITDAGAIALAAKESGLQTLTSLYLYRTRITDAGLAALAAKESGLQALTTLNLFETQITDAGAAALAAKDSGLRALTSLDLGGTQITDAGVRAIKARYPGIEVLR